MPSVRPYVQRRALRSAPLFLIFVLAFPLIATSALAAGPPVERRTLGNGARLLVSEQHDLPMVIVQILVDAGGRQDPKGREGLASLTADLLTEGAGKRTAAQISETADFIGASLSTSADLDYATASITMLRKDLDTGIELLADVLLRPTFPEVEVTRRREATLAALTSELDEPGRVAARAFVETLFAGEPYGHPAIGNTTAVKAIQRSDILSFYRRHYRPDGAIITVVGDVTASEIETRLGAALSGWEPGATAFAYPEVTRRPPVPVRIDKPITQTNILLGHRGVSRDNPDYYALTVMNFILGGGGFTSRLLDNIRTKAGLAYSVSSGFTASKDPGAFQISLQTKNTSANDALRRACAEVARIRQEPVSDDELDGAKLYLTGSFPLRFDSNRKIAGFIAQAEFFGLGADYADRYAERIQGVTKEEVLRVAQQYLRPDELQLVVVGNLTENGVGAGAPCMSDN